MTFPTLPESWVDRIFAEMALTYGSDWLAKWEGLETQLIKARWAKDLGGFMARGDAIQYGLDHLPVDRPPNSLQFRVTCLAAPDPNPPSVDQMLGRNKDVPQLPGMPAKKADITKLKAALDRYKELRAEAAKNPRAWAKELRAKEKAGIPITPTQVAAWRVALRVDDPSISNIGAAGGGTIEVIPNEALPPGMRKGQR